MGIVYRSSFWSKTTGSPPKDMYVSNVVSDSPADDAGIQLGDEIRSVDGKPTTELYVKELKKRYYETDPGKVITLELFNHATHQTKIAELKLRSNKTWQQEKGVLDRNYWGLRVRYIAPAKIDGHFFPMLKRIARWETVQVVRPHASKKHRIKTEPKPVYVVRRARVFTWAGKSLALIERKNRIVEVIEASEVPESDDVVGRLLNAGATLTLNADGTYELTDAPAKAEPTCHVIRDK